MVIRNPFHLRRAAVLAVMGSLLARPLLAADSNSVNSAQEPVAETSTAAVVNDFSAFRVLTERNIFDPSRRKPAEQTTREVEKPAAPQVDVVSLAGTLSYGDRKYAFFDSTVTEFKKALSPGDSLAGFTVDQVTPDWVQLARDEKRIELKVGQQLRREDGGEWQVTSGLAIDSTASTGGNAASEGADPAEAGDAGDVLKRLLEKRKKESGQ